MTDKIREAFEKWGDESDDIPNDGPWEKDSMIQFAWAGYQACASELRAELEAAKKDAANVIALAKESLQYINKLDDDRDFLNQPDYEQLHEALAAIKEWEKL